MATDLYKLCPCGSGKKIKFCCRDIISDLERIQRMIDGEQRLAAIEKIDKLLEKYPKRAALLSQKARVQMQLKQWEDAQQTVDQLLEEDAQSMTGLALRCMLRVNDSDMQPAVHDLHLALELGQRTVTQPVYEAIFALCVGFIAQGNVLAARAYLTLIVSITQGKDRRALALLLDLDAEPSISLLLKENFRMLLCREGVTWRREFEHAIEAERNLNWYAAAELLENMSSRILDEPAILRNLAVLKGRIGQSQEAAKVWRMYSAVPALSMDEAVESEARAQLLEPVSESDQYDAIRISHPINDAEAIMERLLSDRRCERAGELPETSENEPPPKGIFHLLDRPFPEGGDQLTLEQLPHYVARILVYGRETDRQARLMILITRNEESEQVLETLREITGEEIGSSGDVDVYGKVHKVADLLGTRIRFPSETPSDRQKALISERFQKAIIQQWPETKLGVFGGRSAVEAANEPRYKVPVLGAILCLELQVSGGSLDIDFNELRHSLNLQTRGTIDPSEVDLQDLPLVRFAYLDVEKLTDDDLLALHRSTTTLRSDPGLKKLAEEVLRRPSLDDKVSKIEVHEYLAELTNDTDEALSHLSKARQLAVAQGESPARWLISELEIHLTRGDIEHAQRLMSEIQTRYINEPGVGQALMEVLAQFGLVRPGAAAGGQPTAQVQPDETQAGVPSAATESSGLWTPDSAAPAADQASPQKESKLWVPGMD